MRTVMIVISTHDPEIAYNAGVAQGDEVSVFMLGKGILFEQESTKSPL